MLEIIEMRVCQSYWTPPVFNIQIYQFEFESLWGRRRGGVGGKSHAWLAEGKIRVGIALIRGGRGTVRAEVDLDELLLERGRHLGIQIQILNIFFATIFLGNYLYDGVERPGEHELEVPLKVLDGRFGGSRSR